MVKNLPAIWETPGFDPSLRTIPWRRKWQPTPLFLPGKSHGQRSLVGYSPWGSDKSDTTDHAGKVMCKLSTEYSRLFREPKGNMRHF